MLPQVVPSTLVTVNRAEVVYSFPDADDDDSDDMTLYDRLSD